MDRRDFINSGLLGALAVVLPLPAAPTEAFMVICADKHDKIKDGRLFDRQHRVIENDIHDFSYGQEVKPHMYGADGKIQSFWVGPTYIEVNGRKYDALGCFFVKDWSECVGRDFTPEFKENRRSFVYVLPQGSKDLFQKTYY